MFVSRKPLTRLLVTGGVGFIGSNYIRHLMTTQRDVQIVNLDKLGYGSNPANLKNLEGRPNYRFVKGDICDAQMVEEAAANVGVVVNLAAETHVDRSISNPESFLESNTKGVLTLLELCRKRDLKFLQISTDEVYGSADDGRAFKEIDTLNPSSPYSASKAAAEMLVKAYHKTYGLVTLITRCTNNFGPFQFPEKFIPKAVILASQNRKIPVYGSGRQVRDWIHVQDHCEAVDEVLERGRSGEVYNLGGGNQIENEHVVKQILKLLGKPEELIDHVEDRPGHDVRYRLDTSKVTGELGWKPKRRFEDGLRETVTWYVENEAWWQPLLNERVLSSAPWKSKW
jgi:dTDP-glucose 4,6-dehydratase